MPRKPREQEAGAFYHVTTRGNRGQLLFEEPNDYAFFLRLLGSSSRRFDWEIHAYCLMPNHFHLALRLRRPTLSLGMHRINSDYAHAFNALRALNGHLFGARFFSREIATEWHLFEVVRYLALNPVRAGLSSTPSAWPWSSYRFLANPDLDPPPYLETRAVLAHFGRELRVARANLRRFVTDAPPVS